MVRMYFFPSHSFDNGPIRLACIRSRTLVVLIGPTGLGFDGGFVLLPFRQSVQVLVPDPSNPLASGRVFRVSNEMCPYLSCNPCRVSLLTLRVTIFVSSGMIHMVPVIPRLIW